MLALHPVRGQCALHHGVCSCRFGAAGAEVSAGYTVALLKPSMQRFICHHLCAVVVYSMEDVVTTAADGSHRYARRGQQKRFEIEAA